MGSARLFVLARVFECRAHILCDTPPNIWTVLRACVFGHAMVGQTMPDCSALSVAIQTTVPVRPKSWWMCAHLIGCARYIIIKHTKNDDDDK